MMPSAWKRFLLIRLPIAIVVLGVGCQVLAYTLSDVPVRRNRIDELALALRNDHQPHRILLLGDSIIRNATLQYGAGRLEDVLNLSTQGYVGLPGDMFMLERYLQSHRPPQYVVIAAAPDDYVVNVNPRMVHYYMWNTFSDPGEHAFLKAYMPSIDARENYPAALDLQERIVEKLIGLARRRPAHFDEPPPPPDPRAPVEPADNDVASDDAAVQRLHSISLSLAPIYRASLAKICQLGRQYGIAVNVVWAPMPPVVEKGRVDSGQLATLDKQVQDVFAENGCQTKPIFDMNEVQTFTNFDSGAFHLRGSGWEQRAAAILGQYLADLPDRSLAQQALTGASEPVSDTRLSAHR